MIMGDDGMETTLNDLMKRSDAPKNRCICRLRTTMWADNRGAYIKKSITFLKRRSIGYRVLEEDVNAVGAEEVLSRIVNLNECDDGIYEVMTINESRDWETGYIDDYDYKLIQIKEEPK